jgi:hypothetical protein
MTGADLASRDRRRFGVLCVLAYVALAWLVRFDLRRGDQIASLAYPLDTFSMYAPNSANQISHILVRDAAGAVHHVTSFERFACAEALRGSAVRCTERRGFQYHYDDQINWIEAHPGGGATRVELISRTWDVQPGAAPVHLNDCVIAHCTVTP